MSRQGGMEVIGWGITLAYMLIGAFYARRLIGRWSRDSESLCFDGDGFERTGAAMGALGLGLIWPLAGAFYFLRGWLWRPVDKHEERLNRLQQDRDDWWQRERNATTDEERKMAHDIRTTLDDILNRETSW